MLYKVNDRARELNEEDDEDVGRTAFRRDYGRLLHSPSFRRLQGKTQLFPGHESDFFRNRLTHSLEVAQIAKGIAQKLNVQCEEFKAHPIDLDLVEFAGLAHDLGHPPFGHNGERALDDCMRQYGGFEGNAQTLRILTKVEKKIFDDRAKSDPSAICGILSDGTDARLGLNVTYRSLAAILKYDSLIPHRRKKGTRLEKGYYLTEAELVGRIKEKVGAPREGAKFKTIECQIMDIADDIAYSTYDLEDAMKGGFLHPLSLITSCADRQVFMRVRDKVKKEVADVKDEEVAQAIQDLCILGAAEGITAAEQYKQSKLIASNGRMRTDFSSELVGQFMRGVSVVREDGENMAFAQLRVQRDIKVKIETLKHLSYVLTIMSPRLKVLEYRGYEVVKTIFETLNSDEGHLLLPDDVQHMHERLKDTDSKKRLICDFVAGMTDHYAIQFYSRLKEGGASLFKPL